ncbi:MAG: YciI family protein [Kofleriaceae bacterium]|nr:MAG: YciI family protein [Kofleriaceae bacterium]MBZ0234715.1 YciI family protein [Kofleriaceae bacterium]
MKVMVIVKATPNSEQGVMPSQELLDRMTKYNDELIKAGVMLAGDGLQPSSKGRRIQFSGSKRTVVDGPFAETKELIAGFWIWQVKSIEEAIEWARRCPDPMPGEEGELEIRPIYELDAFDEISTPEIRDRLARQQAELDKRAQE